MLAAVWGSAGMGQGHGLQEEAGVKGGCWDSFREFTGLPRNKEKRIANDNECQDCAGSSQNKAPHIAMV